jgi:hypothetical protein
MGFAAFALVYVLLVCAALFATALGRTLAGLGM